MIYHALRKWCPTCMSLSASHTCAVWSLEPDISVSHGERWRWSKYHGFRSQIETGWRLVLLCHSSHCLIRMNASLPASTAPSYNRICHFKMPLTLAHAQAILSEDVYWVQELNAKRIMPGPKISSNKTAEQFERVAAKFLRILMEQFDTVFRQESILDQFWKVLGSCHRSLQKNSEILFCCLFYSSDITQSSPVKSEPLWYLSIIFFRSFLARWFRRGLISNLLSIWRVNSSLI